MLLAAGVSRRMEPIIRVLPFTVQPPPGEGIAAPAFGAVPVPVTAMVSFCAGWRPSRAVSVYVPVTVPRLCGVNVTGSMTVSPAPSVMPAGTGTGVPNGTDGAEKPLIVIGRLPVSAMLTVRAACCPSGTGPNLTRAREALRVPRPVTPVPPRLTAATVPPRLPARLSEPVCPPAAAGLKLTVTVSDSPGLIVVPAAGSPLALNGPAGAMLRVTVSAAVPPLVITTWRLPPDPVGTVPNCTDAGEA